MAARTFLTAEQVEEARKRLKAPLRPPNGDERRGLGIETREFSTWLGSKLLERLSHHPDWLASEPIILGSWAREELCAKSDIDLLFLGPGDHVTRLVQDVSREGLKLRYRVPEDPKDWTKGVLPFDVIALLSAVPIRDTGRRELENQLGVLRDKGAGLRRELLKAMREERSARAARYDSISSFLEPNLKFGPGGLRDLEQALTIRQLYPEKFLDHGKDHAFVVLSYYKSFFLLIREKLHLTEGASDVLSAPEQAPLSEWLGFSNPREFMREVQKGLARVSFYSDWAIAQASSARSRIRRVEERKLDTVSSLFVALSEDPSILMQNRIRLVADQVFASGKAAGPKIKLRINRMIGKKLAEALDPDAPEAPMVALFRSRLIDHCLPEFRRIVGHVQHDQYHRFSVDAHILQVLRELKRLRRRPNRAGRMSQVVRSLSKKEWSILAFAALFHDIAKGRGGDHSLKGIEIARADLTRFGQQETFVNEVAWLVEEHLALSAAAFRENPKSPRTWRALSDRGVSGARLRLLAVFTIVDILGTNPEAWTPWKERLLHELVATIARPETDLMLEFSNALRSSGINGWERLTEALDPFLIASLPAKTLVNDLRGCLDPKFNVENSHIVVVRVRGGGQTWIRFHSIVDRPGLFLGYVRWLAACGLGVRHASIMTDPELGVYDWFEVKTSKSPAHLRSLLESAMRSVSEKEFSVFFDSIDLVAEDDREWVISFRGRDQNGALSEAARALFEEGAPIRWAKVHTWGRQIDDVFGVMPVPGRSDPKTLIERLKSRLNTSGR